MISYRLVLLCWLATLALIVEANHHHAFKRLILNSVRKHAAAAAAAGSWLNPSIAEAARTIGEVPTSGFIFKDTLKVQEFEGMLCLINSPDE